MDEMPIVSEKNIIDRVGGAFLEACFSNQLILVPHQGNNDFGIDYSCELIDNVCDKKTTTGLFASIQLKTHKKILWTISDDFSQSINVSTANYWLKSNVPVLLVLVDLSSYKIYGVDAKKSLRENFDLSQMNNQKTISIKLNKKDIFNVEIFKKSVIEFKKYELLETSMIDSWNIYNFIKYFNDYSHRDMFMLVDDYDDFTRDILALSDRYFYPFLYDEMLVKMRNDMYKNIEKHLINNVVDYDNFTEQDRTSFNELAFDYLKELTQKICDEIDNDKTQNLKKRLYKFKRLNVLIDKYGRPNWNDKWSNSTLNEMNCDYDFENLG